MKAQERHHLKQNEFAITAAKVADAFVQHRSRILTAAGAVVLIAAIAGVYFYVQNRTTEQANALFGAALMAEQAQIVPPPTVPGAVQQAGTYPTEQARSEAAIAAFQKVVETYPDHQVGLGARYHLGGIYLSMGRSADAEQAFAEVAGKAGSSLYGPMARLGQAQALAAQTRYDDAIKLLADLSGQRDLAVPIDGVLMELARLYEKAGKTSDARAAFKRVVDEFPQSSYAGEARQRLAALG